MVRTEPSSRPRLARHVRMRYDAKREQHVLLSPETVWVVNAVGASIVELCDGQRTVTDIEEELRKTYDQVPEGQVLDFVSELVANRRLEVTDG